MISPAARLMVRFVGLVAPMTFIGLALALSAGPLVAQREDQPMYVEDQNCVRLIRSLYADRSYRSDRSERWQQAKKCAAVEDARRLAAMLEVASRELFRLGNIPMEIPEQHDEQRLMGDAGRLGPPAGIFTSPYLGNFRQPWQFTAHTSPGVLVAFVTVLRDRPGPVPSTYNNLKLNYGMNCVFLLPKTGTPSGYEAWVLNPPGNGPCRTTGGPNGTPQGPLDVRLDTTHVVFDDNVNAARWAEDLANGQQPLMSIPCLHSWCEIGPPGFSSHRPSAPPDPLVPDGRESRVKGWHDEQDLEVMDNGGLWVPSGIRGTIVPDALLGRRSLGSYRDIYITVAKVYLSVAPTPGSKLETRGLRQGWNRIELRNDVAGMDGNPPEGWHFRIVPETNPLPAGTNPAKWHFTQPHRHDDAPVPATARWRFTLLDPGIWVMCGQYCCEADGTT